MASPNSTEDTWLPTTTTAAVGTSVQHQQSSDTDTSQLPPSTAAAAALLENPPMSHYRGESTTTIDHQNDTPTTAQVNSDNDELITVPVISLRMLMTSKDVGSIIGKAGMTIKAFREQSGAKINISNGTSSERLVTVTGTKGNISTALTAITAKIQQDNLSLGGAPDNMTIDNDESSSMSLRLIVQTSQCGSLIGKGGSKIKDLRESTTASVQVAGESLPNSTERTVTVTGDPESVTRCIEEICDIMIDCPPKGPFIPYKPHPPSTQPQLPFQPRPNLPFQTPYNTTVSSSMPFNTSSQPSTTTQHMRIPNDLIGCVIGRKGTKIHEIRVNSGAMIKIAGNEGDGSDRLVTITGSPESVGLAQYLINSRIHSEVNNFLLGSV